MDSRYDISVAAKPKWKKNIAFGDNVAVYRQENFQNRIFTTGDYVPRHTSSQTSEFHLFIILKIHYNGGLMRFKKNNKYFYTTTTTYYGVMRRKPPWERFGELSFR